MADTGEPYKRSFSDMESSSSPQVSCLKATVKRGSQEERKVIEFHPRSYQYKVFEVAMKRNTIAVLDTGAGKTMIAVMLIKQICEATRATGLKTLIIFLAPTVHLVNQQYEVIRIHTTFQVGEYYGAKGVDGWTQNCWSKEVDENDVLVMTPQILLDALRKAFLNLEMVSLIIIDECHRATGNHPYSRMMKEFYHKSTAKPKVFGMTASPVVRKGVSSAVDCANQISELESILDSQIYTIEERTEMDLYIHSAKETCRLYDKVKFCDTDLKARIEASWSKHDDLLLALQESVQSCYQDLDDKTKALRRRLSKDHSKILNCLEDLGIICAFEAVKVCLENIPNINEEHETYREMSLHFHQYLEELLCIIDEFMPHGDYALWDFGLDDLKSVELGYISPKLHELLQLFISFGTARQVLCLIFVERIVTAKVIQRFVKKVPFLAHFSVSYLTGSNTSVDALTQNVQKEKLESFRSGKVNLLFATDVLEEGIHVPNCSSVIRFDLPKTVRSYVQSRGRARQNDSEYILMLERGNMKQRDQLFDIIRSEWSMTEMAVNRDPNLWTPKVCSNEETKSYVVDLTGASITADSSVSLIYQYCEKLPGDRYYTPRPTFEVKFLGQSCQCTLELPPNAAFQTIVGPVSRNQQLAKQHVCLEACKKLHQLGALDDHLLPAIEHPSENDFAAKDKVISGGAGTTKRKELHGTTLIRALSGNWIDNLDGATFYAYKFHFSCNVKSEIYSGFVLLIESKLDDDVGDIEFDLYLIGKMVKATVSSCGQVYLDAEQMVKAKHFQELLFNGLFGKLYSRSKQSNKPREFLVKNKTKSHWRAFYMYLLLPLDTCNSPSQGSLAINWAGVGACSRLIDYLKVSLYLDSRQDNHDRGNKLICSDGSSLNESNSLNTIHLADTSVNMSSLKDMVVLAIHTGRLYSVVEVVSNTSSESPFEGKADDPQLGRATTYAEYFHKKYAIVLRHPGQPLLRLKQSHNPHNLLVNFGSEDGLKDNMVEKQQQYAHMPPELLVSMGISFHVLRSVYLIPSVMHRLESLMLASQLRQEIACCSPDFNISSSLILEAITTPRCCENFSLERLELLGDSVLKYAVSCQLFLNYPQKHEGQLSYRRSLAVCNSTLHKLGIGRGIQGYIRDGAFDPRRWIAPGQQPIRPVPCKCGVDTFEVPSDAKYLTEDPTVKVAKSCDMGHRWISSKTISDCVEAVIGAYYISGGLVPALHVMKWLGVDAELDPSLVVEAINSRSLWSHVPKEDDTKVLESKLGYTFCVKFLLQEATTHATMREHGVCYCYQRLEFLGDAVLDLLITFYLYQNHTDVDPGKLTDLRSASVSNEHFAQVAVRRDLYKHLQHCSALLLSQITDYVKFVKGSDETAKATRGPKAPKALGDLVESIAGAMLIDTNLNLDLVWKIFQPLLSPLVTLESLELPPVRQLRILCDHLGYFIGETYIIKGEMMNAQLSLQLSDFLLVGEGYDRNKKDARGKAASHLLNELEKIGIVYSDGCSRIRKDGADHILDRPTINSPDDCLSVQRNLKRHKTCENQQPAKSARVSSGADGPKGSPPVIEEISMVKGGPRSTLFDLCKRLQWSIPKYEAKENQLRTPIQFDQNKENRKAFNSFISKVIVEIPYLGIVECTGDARADKKSSYDSAAVAMLHELKKQGQIIIGSSE
ncbi:hypothetical protein K2173_016054 [Erythroxylum novogranatense]|uniref:Dicer-like 3 n=1 Tax=Erythroxylum novogranatense TaxID=1862640 RepID=A0AAV8SFU7_9ROSI|nr:hypothetical protein K2173_016054 [Erythroxylum novogranatense]